MADDLATAIMNSARRLQIDPIDLATAISYETGGTFDPWQAGPTTQWGQHRGLIQWGEPQRKQYGVYEGMPNSEQLSSVEKYLTDAGVKPNMGLVDIYSAINAGQVNRPDASDADNGGAWGTVADKVKYQMDGHRKKAQTLLSEMAPPDTALGGDRRLAMTEQRDRAMNPAILGQDRRSAMEEQRALAVNPAILGADARQSAQTQQMAVPQVDPAASPIGNMLGSLLSGFSGMSSGTQPAGPRVLQDDSGQALAAAQGLAERGKALKNAFMPDVAGLISLGKRPPSGVI